MPAISNPKVPYCGFGATGSSGAAIAAGATAADGGAGGVCVAQAARAVVASANAMVRSMMTPPMEYLTVERTARSPANINRRPEALCLQTAAIQAFARRLCQRLRDHNRQAKVD